MNPQAAAVEFLFHAVDAARIDDLSDLCEELGAVAISVITDPHERAFAEPGIATAPLALPADVSVHFAPDSDTDALRHALADAFPPLPPLTVNTIAATDWNAAAAARTRESTIAF